MWGWGWRSLQVTREGAEMEGWVWRCRATEAQGPASDSGGPGRWLSAELGALPARVMRQQEAKRPGENRVGAFQRKREFRGKHAPPRPRLGLHCVACRRVLRGETADCAVTGPERKLRLRGRDDVRDISKCAQCLSREAIRAFRMPFRYEERSCRGFSS